MRRPDEDFAEQGNGRAADRGRSLGAPFAAVTLFVQETRMAGGCRLGHGSAHPTSRSCYSTTILRRVPSSRLRHGLVLGQRTAALFTWNDIEGEIQRQAPRLSKMVVISFHYHNIVFDIYPLGSDRLFT